MRTLRTVMALGVLAVLISACSALIPDQKMTNPLGLDGTSVTLSQTSVAGIATKAPASTTFSGSTPATFPDQNLSSVPSWATPNGFSTDISATSVTLEPGASGTLPATLDVTEVTFDLKVTDGSGNPSVTWKYDSGAKSQILVLTQQSCGTTSQGCTYSVAAGSDLQSAASLIPVSLTPSQVSTLWTIIGKGGSPNDVNASVGVTVNQSLPSGTQMVVKLGNASGTLSF